MGFEVAYDPGENIKIVKAVKRYPVLYDFKRYPSFEFRTSVEAAWTKVALELGVTESSCKNRWTNIKGCFKRYLRNKSRSRNTKTYYLANYLDFMLPFMKLNYVRGEGKHAIQEQVIPGNVKIYNDKMDVGNDFEVKLVDSDGEEESFFISTNSTQEEIDIENPDWSFFLSLLPDIQKMNTEQKSKFRNSLLGAIDTVLYGEDF